MTYMDMDIQIQLHSNCKIKTKIRTRSNFQNCMELESHKGASYETTLKSIFGYGINEHAQGLIPNSFENWN